MAVHNIYIIVVYNNTFCEYTYYNKTSKSLFGDLSALKCVFNNNSNNISSHFYLFLKFCILSNAFGDLLKIKVLYCRFFIIESYSNFLQVVYNFANTIVRSENFEWVNKLFL